MDQRILFCMLIVLASCVIDATRSKQVVIPRKKKRLYLHMSKRKTHKLLDSSMLRLLLLLNPFQACRNFCFLNIPSIRGSGSRAAQGCTTHQLPPRLPSMVRVPTAASRTPPARDRLTRVHNSNLFVLQ